MKPTERAAHHWLQERFGYSADEIDFRYCDSPDFVSVDGRRWEVKRLVGRVASFYVSQIVRLRTAPTTVLLWRDDKYEPTAIFDFAEIPLPGRWADFISHVTFQPRHATPVQVQAGQLEVFIQKYWIEHPKRSTTNVATEAVA